MSLSANLPSAIVETILNGLATFFRAAAGDDAAARHAAAQMLAAYHPENEDELRLAGSLVGFTFQSLDALAQAATPDMPVTQILRLRGCAVSLSRESARAERRLGQLQKIRKQAASAEDRPEPVQPQPRAETAPVAAAVLPAARSNQVTEAKSAADRQAEARILASLQRAEARFGPMGMSPTPAAPNRGGAPMANRTG